MYKQKDGQAGKRKQSVQYDEIILYYIRRHLSFVSYQLRYILELRTKI